ncbi:Hypothetical Protein FCC1311_045162 [Hondaea fermentalgiana]|uniref:Leucine zipper transcription factor-like protein 1 n=1 Tax=Hondaea fermentalgiana TaxID=2315210 RepID=A0A2R5GI12_9STRA|nr:Hypothetical Protein FCC1311_045162 [Hondaea fermentalgiana]|eukprot:GBG28293.1 Hypothetical Protein FCC1311_045162 [Hondaea fermentalgiana]
MALQLSAFHREQLAKYIKFFKQKREVQVQEIQEIFTDAQEARLDGDALLDPEEVKDILQSLCESLKTSYEDDLRRTVSMSVLAIQQLFQDADAQDLELEMDTSKIEDSHLLAEVDKIRLDGHGVPNAKSKAGRLVSLRDEQQRIVEQNAQLQDQIASARKENESLHDELDRARQQLSNCTYEVESLKRQLDTAVSGRAAAEAQMEEAKSSGTSSSSSAREALLRLQAELDEERTMSVDMRAKLADARQLLLETHDIDLDDVSARFRASKQFQQMRKTLSQKTDQLTDLRRRLLRYEPDEAALSRDIDDTPLKHHK